MASPLQFEASESSLSSGGHSSPNNEHPNGSKYGLSDLRENYSIIFGDGGGDQNDAGKESRNVEEY